MLRYPQPTRLVCLMIRLKPFRGYSELTVVPCCVNGFTPRVGRR
jgi:hypothetical protein